MSEQTERELIQALLDALMTYAYSPADVEAVREEFAFEAEMQGGDFDNEYLIIVPWSAQIAHAELIETVRKYLGLEVNTEAGGE